MNKVRRHGEKGDEDEEGDGGIQALWVRNIKSDVSLSSDWQEIIDKCVYWLFFCDCWGKAIIRTIMSESRNPCAW